MSNLQSLGELGLIRKIRKMIGSPCGNLEVGLGDDAAVFLNSSKKTIATTDMLIEGIHFDFKFGTPFEIGWQAMAANLSDIAAMGGWPLYALVGLGARPDTSFATVMAIYRGMLKLAKRFNCQIVGGDTVSTSGPFTISLAIIGSPLGKKVFLRSSAKPGDKILVTGWLGKAALALREGKMIRLIPRLEEIKYLSTKIKINALIDLSDGLSSDLTRIAEESKTGALIFEESLPLAPAIIQKIEEEKRVEHIGKYNILSYMRIRGVRGHNLMPLKGVTGRPKADHKRGRPRLKEMRSEATNFLAMVLNVGEDFELLMTTPEKSIESVAAQFKKRFNLPLSCIGEIRPGNYGLKIRHADGREKRFEARGYEHFKT